MPVRLFLLILAISFQSVVIILCTLLFRKISNRRCNRAMCFLWALVAVRLLLPISFASHKAGIPNPANYLTAEYEVAAQADRHASADNTIGNQRISDLPIPDSNTADFSNTAHTPLLIIIRTASFIWILGVLFFCVYNIIAYIKLRVKLSESISEDNIMLCDQIHIPFVFGLFRPRIFIPSNLTGDSRRDAIAHESVHLNRKDNLLRFLYICALALHWFNPFAWIAFRTFDRDLELACDDSAISSMTKEEKDSYVNTLLMLSCSGNRNALIHISSFSNGLVRERLVNILSPQKSSRGAVIACLTIGVVVFSTSLITHAHENVSVVFENDTLQALRQDYPQYFNLPTEGGLTVFVSEPISGEYRCALFAGSNLHPANADLLTFRNNGVDLEAMNAILSTYDISQENIHIQPVIDLLSSYSGGLNTVEGQTDSVVFERLQQRLLKD